MDESFKIQSQQNGGSAGELDEVRRVLVETNIYLLGTTFFVSLLHMLFEMLAFKSDIVSNANLLYFRSTPQILTLKTVSLEK